MTDQPLYKWLIVERSSVTLRAVLVKNGVPGEWLTPADFSAISISIFDLSNNNAAIIEDVPLEIASIILDPPLNDMPHAHANGYNLMLVTDPAWFPVGERIYRAEIKFTGTAGQQNWAIFNLSTFDVLST